MRNQTVPAVDIFPAEQDEVLLEDRLDLLLGEPLPDRAAMLVIYLALRLIQNLPPALPGHVPQIGVFEIERAQQFVTTLQARLDAARGRAECLPRRPRVFFEEWDDPLISAIGWVSELIETAGGSDVFADRATQAAAKDRVVTLGEVIERQPDLIIGSWCGKKFRPERVAARPSFAQVPAVQHGDLYEIKSSLILQPGPAALTDGLDQLVRIVGDWVAKPASSAAK